MRLNRRFIFDKASGVYRCAHAHTHAREHTGDEGCTGKNQNQKKRPTLVGIIKLFYAH